MSSRNCQVDAADAQTAGLEEGPALQVGGIFLPGCYLGDLGMGRGYPGHDSKLPSFFFDT